ncbi:MAG: MBL fold metallo-hydrolase [Calditrichaeota bacterium]|nr:MAG: MBL fold metallo-hydrolase [Calditrichota bacterium]
MLDQVTITVLCENRVAKPDLIAEQGLSLHISTMEGNFLFDTGCKDTFLLNAEKLGIDLSQIKYIFLSHGHRDHTGGLRAYLEKCGPASVVCHYTVFNRKFRVINGGRLEVGIPYEEGELTRMGAQFTFKSSPFNLSRNVISSGEIPRITEFETPLDVHQELVLESYLTDEMNDDMSLILKTRRGLVILLGDAHRGVINTVQHAIKVTGVEKVYAIMGGMNLQYADRERIEQTAEALKAFRPEYLIPLHSTGFYALYHFYSVFRDRVLLLNTGDRFVITG